MFLQQKNQMKIEIYKGYVCAHVCRGMEWECALFLVRTLCVCKKKDKPFIEKMGKVHKWIIQENKI